MPTGPHQHPQVAIGLAGSLTPDRENCGPGDPVFARTVGHPWLCPNAASPHDEATVGRTVCRYGLLGTTTTSWEPPSMAEGGRARVVTPHMSSPPPAYPRAVPLAALSSGKGRHKRTAVPSSTRHCYPSIRLPAAGYLHSTHDSTPQHRARLCARAIYSPYRLTHPYFFLPLPPLPPPPLPPPPRFPPFDTAAAAATSFGALPGGPPAAPWSPSSPSLARLVLRV
jgi:hypothetical protein